MFTRLNETSRSLISMAILIAYNKAKAEGKTDGLKPIYFPIDNFGNAARTIHVRRDRPLHRWGIELVMRIEKGDITVTTIDDYPYDKYGELSIDEDRLNDVIYYYLGENGIRDIPNIWITEGIEPIK